MYGLWQVVYASYGQQKFNSKAFPAILFWPVTGKDSTNFETKRMTEFLE